MSTEWTAPFPENDPVYQFFLMILRLTDKKTREKELILQEKEE